MGVAPPRFRLEYEADVYTPLGQLDPLILNNRATHDGLFTLARLKPGVSVSQAQAEMSTIQSRLDRLYANDNRDLGIYVEPLKQAIVGDAGQTLTLLSGAVGLVLLIACANVANLLLARAAARNREFAIRSALGANRTHVARQLMTESVILSLAGGSLGIAIAFFGIKSVLVAMPDVLPRSEDVRVNAAVLLYTLTVSLLVGILFGLAPALKAGAPIRKHRSREGGRSSPSSIDGLRAVSSLSKWRSRSCCSSAPACCSGQFFTYGSVPPGFDTKNVITLKAGVSHSLTKTPSDTRVAYQQLMERIRQIPGVAGGGFYYRRSINRTGRIPAILARFAKARHRCKVRHEWKRFSPARIIFEPWEYRCFKGVFSPWKTPQIRRVSPSSTAISHISSLPMENLLGTRSLPDSRPLALAQLWASQVT